MELTHHFRVGVPPSQAWAILTDIERIAPCMPGAQLQEVEGDEYRGVVKIKVGPITAQYKGTARFVDKDEAAGRVVLRAEGRDTRGAGNASATITATLVPDGDGTRVTVLTDLTVTGKVAQFGRGVLADVSAKVLGQFVSALETDVLAGAGEGAAAGEGAGTGQGAAAGEGAGTGEGGGAGDGAPGAVTTAAPEVDGDPGPSGADAGAAGGEQGAAGGDAGASSRGPAASSGGPAAAGGAPAGSGPGAAAPTRRRIDSPEAEPVDLFDAAGGSIAKRALPVAAVLSLLLLLLLGRRRRSGRGSGRRSGR